MKIDPLSLTLIPEVHNPEKVTIDSNEPFLHQLFKSALSKKCLNDFSLQLLY